VVPQGKHDVFATPDSYFMRLLLRDTEVLSFNTVFFIVARLSTVCA